MTKKIIKRDKYRMKSRFIGKGLIKKQQTTVTRDASKWDLDGKGRDIINFSPGRFPRKPVKTKKT